MKKIPSSIQKEISKGYISRGYEIKYDLNGIHCYIVTDNGLEKITNRIRKKRSKSKNSLIKEIIKNNKNGKNFKCKPERI